MERRKRREKKKTRTPIHPVQANTRYARNPHPRPDDRKSCLGRPPESQPSFSPCMLNWPVRNPHQPQKSTEKSTARTAPQFHDMAGLTRLGAQAGGIVLALEAPPQGAFELGPQRQLGQRLRLLLGGHEALGDEAAVVQAAEALVDVVEGRRHGRRRHRVRRAGREPFGLSLG